MKNPIQLLNILPPLKYNKCFIIVLFSFILSNINPHKKISKLKRLIKHTKITIKESKNKLIKFWVNESPLTLLWLTSFNIVASISFSFFKKEKTKRIVFE